jgi:hypothetical protein
MSPAAFIDCHRPASAEFLLPNLGMTDVATSKNRILQMTDIQC